MDNCNKSSTVASLQQTMKSHINRGVQTEQLISIRRKLDLDKNDCLSTPPSELKREIFSLRDELVETHALHDLELLVLREVDCAELKSEDKNIKDLEKSLKDAEKLILDLNKEIDNLKSINQDLIKKLKDESHQNLIMKEQYEDQVSKLQLSLKKKIFEIENLEKDKKDFDFRIELLCENYNRKINDFKLLLEPANVKESESEKNAKYNELERRLAEENERTKELITKLQDLELELVSNKEKTKLLEEQIYLKAGTEASSPWNKKFVSLKDVSVQSEPAFNANRTDCSEVSSSPSVQIENLCSTNENDVGERNHESIVSENQSDSQDIVPGNEINEKILNIDNCVLEGKVLNDHYKQEKSALDVSVQVEDILDSNFSCDEELNEIRCSFEQEIKQLKDEYNNKLKSLELANENLHETNSTLIEKLNAANETVQELNRQLCDAVNAQLSRETVTEHKSVCTDLSQIQELDTSLPVTREIVNSAESNSSAFTTVNEQTICLNTVCKRELKELRCKSEKLQEEIQNTREELKNIHKELETLKANYEYEVRNRNDWMCEVTELKADKERLNHIISRKDEDLNAILSELNETKEKLKESALNYDDYIEKQKDYIDLLLCEKLELHNWIKAKEEEVYNLNGFMEKELIKLKTRSESDMEQLKQLHENEIESLRSDNELLYKQIDTIKNMYDTELSKFLKLIEVEKINSTNESCVGLSKNKKTESNSLIEEIKETEKTVLGLWDEEIKVDERNSQVEILESHLTDSSLISITGDKKCKLIGDENVNDDSFSILGEPSCSNETMSLVPVTVKEEMNGMHIRNYDIHTVDENNMQLRINSQSAMTEFINEFAKDLVKENIMNEDELATCTNVFYCLFHKYLLLLDTYLQLKTEYDEYRFSEEKERCNIINRTARYLDTLCSQLEVSGSSLSLSNSSFTSFRDGLPSSTIMDDYSELEMTAVNDVTMTAYNDPLALSHNTPFQTPLTTPLKSGRKPVQFQFKTPLKSVSKQFQTPSNKKQIPRTPHATNSERNLNESQILQVKNNMVGKEKEIWDLKGMYDEKIASSEDIIRETLKSFSFLEGRISNLENISCNFQAEKENLTRENQSLQECLKKYLEEIADIKQKLAIEIVCLNPQLEGTLTDVSVSDVLSVFLNTVMESCKRMPEELSEKLLTEIKVLNEKNEAYEGIIFESTKEMGKLKDLNAALMDEKCVIEKIVSDRNEEIKLLRLEVSEINGFKLKVQDLQERLEESDHALKTETYLRENTIKDLRKLKLLFENIEKENSNLKDKLEQSERIISDLEVDLTLVKKEQIDKEMKEQELVKKIEQFKYILSSAEDKNKDLENIIRNLEDEVKFIKNIEEQKNSEIESLSGRVLNAENLLQERDQLILELKQKILDTETQLSSTSKEYLDCNEKYKSATMEVEQLRQTLDECREVNKTVTEDMISTMQKLAAANTNLASKVEEIEQLRADCEKARKIASAYEETISNLKAKAEKLEKSLELALEKQAETKSMMAEEIETLKLKVLSYETDVASKVQLVQVLSSQLDEANEIKKENEETIKRMMEKIKELDTDNKQQFSKEFDPSLKPEIDCITKRILNGSGIAVNNSAYSDKRVDLSLEKSVQFKTGYFSKRSRLGESPSFISRRLEKLENLNDLLSGTLHKIINALEIPVHDNLFSVGRYEESEAQIMKYISTLGFIKKDLSRDNSFDNTTGISNEPNKIGVTYEKYGDLSRKMSELQESHFIIRRHLGLGEGSCSSQEIVHQIDKLVEDARKSLQERIDILRQDNQHLDDDNNLLQQEMKNLIEQNNLHRKRLEDFEKLERDLNLENDALKAELSALKSKIKLNRKNDLCNRKLDKLEELNQSLIEIIKKMLTLTEMENVQKLNLYTIRTFENESKKILDHFNSWIASKSNKIKELKSLIEELDEECESYAKRIKKAEEETVNIWEEGRSELQNLQSQVDRLEEEKLCLQAEKKTLLEKLSLFENFKKIDGSELEKDHPNCKKLLTEESGVEYQDLRKANAFLQSKIKDLEDELSQSKKQVEELDEECDSYAKAIKEADKETLKVWEETRVEVEALKVETDKLRQEKKALESDNEDLRRKIQIYVNMKKANSPQLKEDLNEPCECDKNFKQVQDLRSTLSLREMKIIELEQLNEKNVFHKSQMKYLENSLAAIRKELTEEKDKNTKLEAKLELLNDDRKKGSGLEVVDKLRLRDSLDIAGLRQKEDKEKLQKLEKDNRMLKELCRTRYSEIKRLESENLTLKGHERATKNSNQMDSPIRTRCYNTRQKKR